jgi:hypothetical protein
MAPSRRLRGAADRPSPSRPGHRARPAVEALEARDTPATFAVTTTADAGPGSLRDAILRANAAPGADRIAFAIPTADPGFVDADADGRFGAGDYWSVAPATALPAVTGAVRVDGRSVIELTGAGAGAGANGLELVGHSGSTVRGLVVNRFGGSGVAITGGGGHTLAGNLLGTDVTGELDRGNALAGVSVADAAFNTLDRNLISGNDLQGVLLRGAGAVGNRVVGNRIGTTRAGDAALANGTAEVAGDGIRVEGGRFNAIGGHAAAERNVVSGNFDDGIDLRDGAFGNAVLGNFVGTDATGTRPLGNGADGVFLENASGNRIGSLLPGGANVLAANGFNGVFLFGASHDNVIAGNFIGTNARRDRLGNGTAADFADGIFLAQFDEPEGPTNTTIVGNTIAFNADSAVAVDLDASGNSAGNRLLANSVFGNGGVAIDLGSDGPTANDPGDADAGPNRLQNSPVLRGPVDSGDGTVTVAASLAAAPRTAYWVEFYASAAGEGEVFLGGRLVLTGEDGTSPDFRLRFAPVAGKPFLTATATNLATGDTSEFSAAVR